MTAEQWEAEAQRLVDDALSEARAVQVKHSAIIIPFIERLAASSLSTGLKAGIVAGVLSSLHQGEKELRG